MPNQIVERAFELAQHAAQHSDFDSFAAAESRLRTLDRQSEIAPRQFLMMEAVAHARAGNTREAKDIIARLGGPHNLDSQHVRKTLMTSTESSIAAYRDFVEQLIPSQFDDSSPRHRRTRKVLRVVIGVGAVLLLVITGLFFYVRSPSADEVAELPKTSGVVIPSVSLPASSAMPVSTKPPATHYERMQRLVGKVIVRYQVLLNDGKSVMVPAASGTGFVIARDGLILTNRHVVDAGPKAMKERDWVVGWDVIVVFLGNETPLTLHGRVGHQSAYVDLATIRVDHQFPDALTFAATPDPGETVKAYGFPGIAEDLAEFLNERDAKQRNAALESKLHEGKEPDLLEWIGLNNVQLVVTSGIVSAVKKTEKGLFLQTDTSINHGNSGGPLINEHGLAVAMATLGLEGTNLCLSSRTIFEELTREPGIEWPKNW